MSIIAGLLCARSWPTPTPLQQQTYRSNTNGSSRILGPIDSRQGIQPITSTLKRSAIPPDETGTAAAFAEWIWGNLMGNSLGETPTISQSIRKTSSPDAVAHQCRRRYALVHAKRGSVRMERLT
jgi:hypothetical protein